MSDSTRVTAASRWWFIKTVPPAVAADVMAARKRPLRFIRLGRLVLCWDTAPGRCDQGWNHRMIHRAFWLMAISWVAMLGLSIGVTVAYV